ncbi:MAG TPA: ATP-binding cassette domain-containing protein [Thermomicrobiales bacterium]|nr:ATP-binding cassette domain-containing protein [Thermomicrobiales bacterium]
MPIITVDNLVKDFHRPKRFEGPLGGLRTLFTRQMVTTRAVDGVSFEIDEGELVGYLGSNGAGKSTTIKMLSGILVPTEGHVEVNGLVPWRQREENALQIGVVFGQRTQLWWDLPLADSLKIIGKLYRMDPARYRRNLDTLTELLGLEPFLGTPVRQLSLGQRMRGDLAAAMLYEPQILYLDEPTVGLDVVAKERTRQFIERINRETGTTIMLTTHDLADVERLCRRIVFIDRGTVLYDGPVDQLKRRYAPWRVLEVTLAADEGDGLDTETIQLDIPGAEIVERGDARLVIRFDPDEINVTDLISAVIARHPVSDISIVEPDLEGVVREIVEAGEVRS